jgi:hypothetical protein
MRCYQMLWGTLLTVRRMVMRPPASTPTRLTRAWPRKLVVCCSADAAIFPSAQRARRSRDVIVCSVDEWGMNGPSWGEHIFIRRLSGARRDWWTRCATRPSEPIGCRLPHWISRVPASNRRPPSGDEDRVTQIQSYLDHTAKPGNSRVPVVLSRVLRLAVVFLYLPAVKMKF